MLLLLRVSRLETLSYSVANPFAFVVVLYLCLCLFLFFWVIQSNRSNMWVAPWCSRIYTARHFICHWTRCASQLPGDHNSWSWSRRNNERGFYPLPTLYFRKFRKLNWFRCDECNKYGSLSHANFGDRFSLSFLLLRVDEDYDVICCMLCTSSFRSNSSVLVGLKENFGRLLVLLFRSTSIISHS